ncbi:MAG: excinuclease ABC subunit UvrC [Candidatus Zophobacter franzmannii]|nr:excinuclease ABC subunit UvrC [Candidatus Zophobacter franzmannii]
MATISPELATKLRLLPTKPGCYLWKDAKGKIIYVGKALNLKNRVSSYLTGKPDRAKTARLVARIADLDYIITNTEAEAFELESNLIKLHRPQYNILLKDDKRYPFIKVTTKEAYPRVFVTREFVKDGNRYFGPHTNVKAVRQTMRLMEWIFPIRRCSRTIPKDKVMFERACINLQLGTCTAPCIGKITQDEYMKTVELMIRFLKGMHNDVINELKIDMQKYAEELQFENAAITRDKIKALTDVQKNRTMFLTDFKNRDVIGLYKEEDKAAAVVLKIVEGKVLHKETYPLSQVEDSSLEEIMSVFISQYYAQVDELPHSILLQLEPTDMDSLNNWLGNRLAIPQRGEKVQLINVARINAFNYVEEQKLAHMRKASRTILPIQELKEQLKLHKLPRKIVCMDISTIQGTDTVSSAVFFENGKPKKSLYRKFIINTVDGQDDFASMAETIERFINQTNKDEELTPDLIVIDGGKGQLNKAYKKLKSVTDKDIIMISLAKRIEEVFHAGNNISILLPRSSGALRMLVEIRDEAHRFAITFHRQRRSKRTIKSDLDEIKGIGDKTRFLLLKEFGSVEGIKNAKEEELAEVKGVSVTLAKKIYSHFRNINSMKEK